MRLLLPEIFDKVQKAETNQQRIEILKQNNSPVLIDLLKMNFHPDITMKLPEGVPPFKRPGIPMGMADSNLYKEMRRMYTWITPPQNLHKIKSETLFIQLLESINEKEADLLCAVKDKNMTSLYSSITYDLVNETFPGLLPPKAAVAEKQQTEEPAPKKRGRPKKNP
jgi:hypothetical protein